MTDTQAKRTVFLDWRYEDRKYHLMPLHLRTMEEADAYCLRDGIIASNLPDDMYEVHLTAEQAACMDRMIAAGEDFEIIPVGNAFGGFIRW